MQIIVSGKQVDVGNALKAHIEDRLEQAVAKYLDKVNTITVVISKEAHQFAVDISGNIGTHSGYAMKSHAKASEAYGAFDAAADKIEKQLRRYKRQLKNHHNMNAADAALLSAFPASQYVISSDEREEEAHDDNPLIIAETEMHIESLTVSDAVMRMDLGDLQALMFINKASERLNMIYRRADGHISWVDPESTLKSAAA
jgi:ribosomal subunit interface protein